MSIARTDAAGRTEIDAETLAREVFTAMIGAPDSHISTFGHHGIEVVQADGTTVRYEAGVNTLSRATVAFVYSLWTGRVSALLEHARTMRNALGHSPMSENTVLAHNLAQIRRGMAAGDVGALTRLATMVTGGALRGRETRVAA